MVLSRNGGNQTEITEPKHYKMEDLPDLIPENTLMIFNNSKVRRSRCYGKTVDTGRECEFLMLTPYPDGTWKAMVKNAKKNKPGKVFVFNDGSKGTIVENPADIGTEFRTVKFDVPITEEWFDDALFIGDSRILGMRYQRRLGKADYFTQMSMSTFSAMYWQLSDARFFDKNLEYVLSNFEYKKILIHLGLNECGYDHELVISAYQDLIDMIRKYQPDAAIIVQSVMTVSRGKATDEQFTLERINNLNRLLRELADQNGLYYQDTNEFAADEEGYLRDDISNDGTHPHNFGYEEWIEFIMKDCARFGIA